MNDFPDYEYVEKVCKLGKGAYTCRYLTVTGRGWSCEKGSTLKTLFDKRVALKQMNARGDNCPGKDSRG